MDSDVPMKGVVYDYFYNPCAGIGGALKVEMTLRNFPQPHRDLRVEFGDKSVAHVISYGGRKEYLFSEEGNIKSAEEAKSLANKRLMCVPEPIRKQVLANLHPDSRSLMEDLLAA